MSEPMVEELPSIWRQEAKERRAFAEKELKSHIVEKMHELAAAYQLEVDAVTLKAALKREGWQPIETAPKDGRCILAGGGELQRPVIVWWTSRDFWADDMRGPYVQFPYKFSYWMPLMPLPKSPQEPEG